MIAGLRKPQAAAFVASRRCQVVAQPCSLAADVCGLMWAAIPAPSRQLGVACFSTTTTKSLAICCSSLGDDPLQNSVNLRNTIILYRKVGNTSIRSLSSQRDLIPSDINLHIDSSQIKQPSEPVAVDYQELLNDLKQVEVPSCITAKSHIVADADWSITTSEKFERALEFLSDAKNVDQLVSDELSHARELLSAENVSVAISVLTSCRHKPTDLSKKMRQWEKSLGKIKWTPLTDVLSLRLLIANGLAGNVGRIQSLLQLRKARGYTPCEDEFSYAVRSLSVASFSQHLDGVRNIFIDDADQPPVDNPTRWLDAILLNMSERNYPLTTPLANRMINCYSATGGRTLKARHFFYKVVRLGILAMSPEEKPLYTDEMPNDWTYVPETRQYVYQPVKVKVKYNNNTPPFYKVPAASKGKFFYDKDAAVGKLKLDKEVEPEYSLPLAAAFAFTESLQHGACGHEPITLDVGSYNGLIKASVVRGALWRAMHVLNSSMPAAGIEPNAKSYNLLLSGFASVGDVVTAQEYYLKMNNAGIKPDKYTVSAIVDGLLNMTDVPGAITVIQDFFNQHNVLPRLSTHSKILELSLGQGLVYEAKRYVSFIQQLWKWEPNQYHDDEFIELMRHTQQSPSLQRDALKKMFAYFGEELRDSDFLP